MITIKLPSNYASDSRWDSVNHIWTFESVDCIPIQYRIEEFQSSQASLSYPYTCEFRPGEIIIDENSTLTFQQDSTNVECTINMNAFTIRRRNDDNAVPTFFDFTNGAIAYNPGSPKVISVPSSALTEVADAVVKSNEINKIGENIVTINNASLKNVAGLRKPAALPEWGTT